MMQIGIRAEDKNEWEARVPLVPEDIRDLRAQGIAITVQTSVQRAFADEEFEQNGIAVESDIDRSDIILGLKEIQVARLAPGKIYFIFSHVIKGQAYNMPMLERMMQLGITLVDYERIVDEGNRRLIFFGRHAGLAGMINSLWALGRRLAEENCPNPLSDLRQARTYRNLEQARHAIRAVGKKIASKGLPVDICPPVVGFAGYGHVSQGAQEILEHLPVIEIRPSQLQQLFDDPDRSCNHVYKVVFKEEDIFEPRDSSQTFDLQEYYRYGAEKYNSVFERYLGHLTLLINGNYWDERFPRIFPLESCRELWKNNQQPRLKVIGDISCDINGSIECTVKPAYPDNPVYVYHPDSGEVTDGFSGHGPVIMAVEILPTEIPRESSTYFSSVLKQYIPQLVAADWQSEFEALRLPSEIKRAMILHRGSFTPDYRYLEDYLRFDT